MKKEESLALLVLKHSIDNSKPHYNRFKTHITQEMLCKNRLEQHYSSFSNQKHMILQRRKTNLSVIKTSQKIRRLELSTLNSKTT